MRHEELISVIEATNAFESLARHVVMNHRGELTKSQMDILITLKFSGSMTMTRLSKQLAVSKEQATRATNPLVEMGFVNRRRNEDNRRLVEVSLSEKAKTFLEEDLESVLKELDESLSCVSEEDRAELIDASKRAARILSSFRGLSATQAG